MGITIDQAFQEARRTLSYEAKEYTVGSIKRDFLSGQVLRVRTGNLRSRIQSDLTERGFEVGTNVVYGVAWELGFHRKEYTIVPRRRKVLRFFVGGQAVFARKVTIPEKTFKARPFIAPAIERAYPYYDALATLHYGRALERVFPPRTITI